MNVTITVSAHYDWIPFPAGTPEAEIAEKAKNRLAKQAADGSWLKKVVKVKDTYTSVSIPEAALDDLLAAAERSGRPKTRAKMAYWYLSEVIMQHHAPEEHFCKIEVEGEPEITKYLNKMFECDEPSHAADEPTAG